MCICCTKTTSPSASCELIDIAAIGYACDSLREKGAHEKAAHLYFEAGSKNQSSELFVYAAWQFGEANKIDSSLIAVQHAIKFGLNSPYILKKAGIEEKTKNSPLRKEIDQLLEKIKAKNASVENFEVVTEPINRFWQYFDQAITDSINGKKYLSEFICDGSNALKDYYHIRYENVDNMYRVMIQKNPEYYRYLKDFFTSGRLESVSNECKKMMQKFAELYPKAVFPKTYIVPDLINGTGTLTESALYIGVDMFAKSDRMPLQNLNDWQIATITEFGNMKFDLVHELMHFQQSYSGTKDTAFLFGKLIEEGACDFLVSLLTENNEVSPSVQRNLNYVSKPENFAFIMSELKRDIYSSDLMKWMHNGGTIKDRPSN
ncbi:MAG: hypothetical protein AAF617_14680, partial [Bacteroidota bacterium]